jgi:hypothetical protein
VLVRDGDTDRDDHLRAVGGDADHLQLVRAELEESRHLEDLGKEPSAVAVATPSNVGVECIHTSTFDPASIPWPSTRVVVPGT